MPAINAHIGQRRQNDLRDDLCHELERRLPDDDLRDERDAPDRLDDEAVEPLPAATE